MKRPALRMDGQPRRPPGRPRSPERIELERFGCTRCGAAPGQACRTAGGRRAKDGLAHAARWRAKDEQEKAVARG